MFFDGARIGATDANPGGRLNVELTGARLGSPRRTHARSRRPMERRDHSAMFLVEIART
jgi:hypothetical protein